jgi:hypothetical protein
MAITPFISTKELKRQAGLVFEGKTLNVMLCQLTDEGLDQESTVASWEAIEVSTGGYVRDSAVIPVGAYNVTSGSYRIPDIEVSFTATATYSYNVVVLFIDTEQYPHSILIENPNVTLSAGQTQSYSISLSQDD